MNSMKNDLMKEWFEVADVAKVDSPALLFYPGRIAQNIDRLKSRIDDIGRLRPHVKTHKSADVVNLLLAAGITKFKSATIAEAEMLGQCGAEDVLLAYQPVGPKLTRYIELVRSFPSTLFSCLFDNVSSLRALSVAGITSQSINVLLDLDLGMNRTGIAPDNKAIDLYRIASTTAGIKLLGLHGYDGHIHEPSVQQRKKIWQAGWDNIKKLESQIIAEGLTQPLIVAGGTPTFPFYAAEADVECSPGTFILWDKGYQDSFAEQDYLIAALLLTRVISLPGHTRVTVDLGHKSVAAEHELTKRVTFLNAPNALIVSQSEEHLVLEMGENHGFKIGDVLYALPKHICPTVALYERATTVENNQVTGEWRITARNKKINI